MKKTKPKLRVKHFHEEYYCIQERTKKWGISSWKNLMKPLHFIKCNKLMLFKDYDEACKEAERLLEGDNLQALKDSLFKNDEPIVKRGETRYFE